MTSKTTYGITDEQIAEIDALSNAACQYAGSDWFKDSDLSAWFADDDAQFIAAASPFALRALISRLRAAEADAARYRWLTDGKRRDYCWTNVLSDRDRSNHDFLEDAIDAAMKGEQQ